MDDFEQNSDSAARNQGRKKIRIARIEDDRNRQVTFLKRKNGLLKKAMELGILCDCEVNVVIFNLNNGKLFEFSSVEPDKILTRYATYNGPSERRKKETFFDLSAAKGVSNIPKYEPQLSQAAFAAAAAARRRPPPINKAKGCTQYDTAPRAQLRSNETGVAGTTSGPIVNPSVSHSGPMPYVPPGVARRSSPLEHSHIRPSDMYVPNINASNPSECVQQVMGQARAQETDQVQVQRSLPALTPRSAVNQLSEILSISPDLPFSRERPPPTIGTRPLLHVSQIAQNAPQLPTAREFVKGGEVQTDHNGEDIVRYPEPKPLKHATAYDACIRPSPLGTLEARRSEVSTAEPHDDPSERGRSDKASSGACSDDPTEESLRRPLRQRSQSSPGRSCAYQLASHNGTRHTGGNLSAPSTGSRGMHATHAPSSGTDTTHGTLPSLTTDKGRSRPDLRISIPVPSIDMQVFAAKSPSCGSFAFPSPGADGLAVEYQKGPRMIQSPTDQGMPWSTWMPLASATLHEDAANASAEHITHILGMPHEGLASSTPGPFSATPPSCPALPSPSDAGLLPFSARGFGFTLPEPTLRGAAAEKRKY